MEIISEHLQSDTRLFRALLEDDTVMTYRADYQGQLDATIYESGAKESLFHLLDDRRCAWSIHGSVYRHVALLSNDSDYYQLQFTRMFPVLRDEDKNMMISANVRAEGCDDCKEHLKKDMVAMRNMVNSRLQSAIADDVERVKADIGTLSKVKAVKAFVLVASAAGA